MAPFIKCCSALSSSGNVLRQALQFLFDCMQLCDCCNFFLCLSPFKCWDASPTDVKSTWHIWQYPLLPSKSYGLSCVSFVSADLWNCCDYFFNILIIANNCFYNAYVKFAILNPKVLCYMPERSIFKCSKCTGALRQYSTQGSRNIKAIKH
jgi:hypothetical protein